MQKRSVLRTIPFYLQKTKRKRSHRTTIVVRRRNVKFLLTATVVYEKHCIVTFWGRGQFLLKIISRELAPPSPVTGERYGLSRICTAYIDLKDQPTHNGTNISISKNFQQVSQTRSHIQHVHRLPRKRQFLLKYNSACTVWTAKWSSMEIRRV